jgi:hypothetical protein
MTTTRPEARTAVNARSLLLPYLLTLFTAMVLIQVVIAMTGGEVTVLAGALTALVAVGIAAWLWRNYRTLTHVRFGVAIAHGIAFAAVTTSFNAHAVLRTMLLGSGDGGSDAAARDLLATPWFGATLVMSAAWGLGLLIHLTGSVLGRGWED